MKKMGKTQFHKWRERLKHLVPAARGCKNVEKLQELISLEISIAHDVVFTGERFLVECDMEEGKNENHP